jgi:hypothetical protein
MNTTNNKKKNDRKNRGTTRTADISQEGRRFMIPDDKNLISINEAHRNVINMVANFRDEDIIIKNNFENDNELVNFFNFAGRRINANIPQKAESSPSLPDESHKNFPIVFNNTVKNIYSQLNYLTVNFKKYRENMAKSNNKANEANEENIWNNINNKNVKNKAHLIPDNDNGNKDNLMKNNEENDNVAGNIRSVVNENNTTNIKGDEDENNNNSSFENPHPKNKNINDSLNNEMEIDDSDNNNEEENEMNNIKNNRDKDIINNNKDEYESPNTSYVTPKKNNKNNNNSLSRGQGYYNHNGKTDISNKDINNDSSSPHKEKDKSIMESNANNNLLPITNKYSKGEIDNQNNNNEESSPENENNYNNNIKNIDSSGYKEKINNSNSGNVIEGEKDNDNKNKENNKTYNNRGTNNIEPKIDATTPENKKYNNNNQINIDEEDSDTSSPEKKLNESDDNIIKTDANSLKKNIFHNNKDKNNIIPNNRENNKKINNYDISGQDKFSFLNKNNFNSNMIDHGTQYIDDNKLSKSFPQDNYNKLNINSFNSINGNMNTENNIQNTNTINGYTPQRETFIFKSYKEDKSNELFYYVKEKKNPHLVICTSKMEDNVKTFYIFISFHKAKPILKSHIIGMDSLMDNRNYINMFEFIIRSGDYYNGYSDKHYNIEQIFIKYKQTGEVFYIPKNEDNTNITNIYNSNSTISISRETGTTNNENNRMSFNQKKKRRKSAENNIKKSSIDTSNNNKNDSNISISLEENDSTKSLAKSQIYKGKYNNCKVGGNDGVLPLKVKKKKRRNKKKKYNNYNNNNDDQEEENSQEEYYMSSEQETQNNSRRYSPIKYEDNNNKVPKVLRGKQRKIDKTELDDMINKLYTPEKRRKGENNNDNKKRKDSEKLNSSKYIELSPNYELSTEKEIDDNDDINIVDSENKDDRMANNNKGLAATGENDTERKKKTVCSGANEENDAERKKTTVCSGANEENDAERKKTIVCSCAIEENDNERKKTTLCSGAIEENDAVRNKTTECSGAKEENDAIRNKKTECSGSKEEKDAIRIKTTKISGAIDENDAVKKNTSKDSGAIVKTNKCISQ